MLLLEMAAAFATGTAAGAVVELAVGMADEALLLATGAERLETRTPTTASAAMIITAAATISFCLGSASQRMSALFLPGLPKFCGTSGLPSSSV
jgi:hypothetical protein